MRKLLLLCLVIANAFSCAEADSPKTKKETKKSTGTGKFPQAEKIFFPDGALQCAGKLVNGKREGTWTSWFHNGAMNSSVSFRGDKMDGEYTVWYENGQVRIHGRYDLDKEIGVWHFMSEKGDTVQTVDFDKENKK